MAWVLLTPLRGQGAANAAPCLHQQKAATHWQVRNQSYLAFCSACRARSTCPAGVFPYLYCITHFASFQLTLCDVQYKSSQSKRSHCPKAASDCDNVCRLPAFMRTRRSTGMWRQELQQDQSQQHAQAHLCVNGGPPVYTEFPLTRDASVRETITLDSAPATAAVVLLHRGAVLCLGNRASSNRGASNNLQAGASSTHVDDDAADDRPVDMSASALASCKAAEDSSFRIAACLPQAAQKAGLEPHLPAVVLGATGTGTLWLAAEVADSETSQQAWQTAKDVRLGDAAADANDLPRTAQQSSDGLTWVDVRKLGASLCAEHSAVAATAVGLLAWHRGNRFSAATGAMVRVERGGWAVRGAGERCERRQLFSFDMTEGVSRPWWADSLVTQCYLSEMYPTCQPHHIMPEMGARIA